MGTLKKSKVKFVKAQDGWEGKGAHGEPPVESKPQQTTRQRFNAAFAAARKDPNNKGVFSFEGKSYTTQTKEEAAKKAAPAAKATTAAKSEAKPSAPVKKVEPAKASSTPEKKDTVYVSPKPEPKPATGGAGPMNPVKDQRGGYANSPERQKIADAANKNRQTLTKSGKVYSQKSGGKTKKR